VRRRDFIALGSVAASSFLRPRAVHAQQPALPVIGFLHSESPTLYAAHLRAFRQGLSEAGYVEGKNVAIEYRWADSRYDRLPELATDLVRRRVNVIAANGPAVPVAKAATATIPIVFFTGGDSVKLGLVVSLSRPGGNLTGVTNLVVELAPKRLELLHELAPNAVSVAVLVNPTFPGAEGQAEAVQAAARALSLQLHVLNASTEGDFAAVFACELPGGPGGVLADHFVFAIAQFGLGSFERPGELAVGASLTGVDLRSRGIRNQHGLFAFRNLNGIGHVGSGFPGRGFVLSAGRDGGEECGCGGEEESSHGAIVSRTYFSTQRAGDYGA